MRTKTRPPVHDRSFIEEARRVQVIAAAYQVVAEVGYSHASLAKIADRAGVSKSVISYHFKGKEDLLRTAVEQLFEDVWLEMEKAVGSETTYSGRIRAWVGTQIACFGARRTEFLAMVEIVTGHRNPDGSRPFADGEEEELEAIAELLAAGQRAGEFRPFDARSVAAIIVRCTEGVLGHWLTEDHENLEAETTTLLDFIDKAIRA